MSQVSELPKVIGANVIQINSSGYLEIAESRAYKYLTNSLHIVNLLIALIAIGYVLYTKQSLATIEIMPAWMLLLATVTHFLASRSRIFSVSMISKSGEVVIKFKEPLVNDNIKAIELKSKRFSNKVIARGYKYDHEIGQYYKRSQAEEVRNIIDEFINQSQDKANSVNQSAS
ncbi:MAG: hypothetical protein KF824_04070 [Fimbriimonadaceae bacterium]|nr:MAG: hypothetical protein KF824_04070 [Fimbriimonadaceae bacterium]